MRLYQFLLEQRGLVAIRDSRLMVSRIAEGPAKLCAQIVADLRRLHN